MTVAENTPSDLQVNPLASFLASMFTSLHGGDLASPSAEGLAVLQVACMVNRTTGLTACNLC